MKKISKLIVLLVALFIGASNVLATQDCSNDEIIGLGGDFYKASSVIMQYGDVSYPYDMYSLHYAGKKLPAYCREPGYVDGLLGSKSNYKCKRVVYDPTTPSAKDDNQKAFDAGVSYIAKGLYRNGKNRDSYLSTFGVSGEEADYTSTNMALRLYEMMWPSFNTNGANSTKDYSAHKNVANRWRTDGTLKGIVESATKSEWKKFDGDIATSFSNEKVENAAKAKFKAAFEYVNSYRQNGGASIVVNENGLKTKSETTDDAGVKHYTGKAVYNIKISEFIQDGASVSMGFECVNCDKKDHKVTTSIEINDTSVTNYASQELLNLSTIANKDGKLSGDIKITVNFDTNENDFDCDLIDYKLKIYYYEKSISGKVYEVYPEGLQGVSGVQAFWVVDEPKKGFKTTITIDDSISLCTPGATGQNCSPNVINAECSDPGYSTNFDIIEGYEVDDECKTSDTANVLGCIVNGEDAAGNPYVVMSNRYCTVSCKEDYNFTFPGNKGVVNGGYFTLAANIRGKKSCYTSAINQEQFLSDFCSSIQQTGTTWNQIQKINAYLKETASSHPSCSTSTKVVSSTTLTGKENCPKVTLAEAQNKCRSTCESLNGLDRKNCLISCLNPDDSYYTCTVPTATKTIVKCSISYQEVKINNNCRGGSISTKTDQYENEDGLWPAQTIEGGELSDANDAFDKAYGKKETTTIWKHGSANASKRMGSVPITQTHIAGDTSVAGLLGQFNSCQAWSLKDYKFDPKMYYWYEFGSGQFTRSNLKVDTESTPYVCTGSVDASYEKCSSGWTSSFQSEEIRFYYCDASGCGYKDSFDVGTAKYVKRSMNASADFTALTRNSQISPSGIIIDDGKGELKEKLPVPLGLDLKPHRYVIYVTDLGEYRAGNLGRIWGNPRSVLSTTLRTKDKCQNSKDLTYDRTVETSYFDNGVYSCTYTTDDRPSCYSVIEQKDIDLTDCIASGKTRAQCEKEYCLVTCVHEKTEEVVSITDCVKDEMKKGQNYENAYQACYKKECCPRCITKGKCTTSDGKYYGIKGTEVTEEQYNDECFCEKKDGKSTELFSIKNCMDDENKTAEECKLECKSKICPPPGCPPRLVCNGKVCFSVRPISPDNINPNDRSMGANWASDDKAETALELKAYVTTQEIVEDGEKIYDYDSAGNFAMEVTLDGKMINFIKEYNNKHDKGGYADNSLECYPYTVGGVTYQNVFCYSTFIDELLKPANGLKNKIKIKPERPTSDKRNNYTPTENGYWTPWNFAKLDSKWTIETEQELAYYKKGYGKTINIGPSWK